MSLAFRQLSSMAVDFGHLSSSTTMQSNQRNNFQIVIIIITDNSQDGSDDDSDTTLDFNSTSVDVASTSAIINTVESPSTSVSNLKDGKVVGRKRNPETSGTDCVDKMINYLTESKKQNDDCDDYGTVV